MIDERALPMLGCMNRNNSRKPWWSIVAFTILVGCGGGTDDPALSGPAEPGAPTAPPDTGAAPNPPHPGAAPNPPHLGAAPPIAAAPASCSGANLSALTTLVYVRSDGSDAGACGTTTANACASIQKGIEACGTAGCGVVVRHGLYTVATPLTLRDGVNVYGGCLFDGETGRSYRSIINGPPDRPAVSAASIGSATAFQGFVVRAADGVAESGPSIAMTVADSGGLSLSQVRLVAGRGAPGGNGADAGVAGKGQDGRTDGTGGQACVGSYSGSASRGGSGGQNWGGLVGCGLFDCTCKPGPVGTASGLDSPEGVKGGPAGANPGTSGCACERPFGQDAPGKGDDGQPGNPGVCAQLPGAASGNIAGTFDASAQWYAASSGDGTAGGMGSGGGGGQGGGMAVKDDGNVFGPAVSGGQGSGGGGGGCGGLPGAGGHPGGASIALGVAGALTGIDARSVFVAGPGGDGGTGGTGGVGGAGGSGGPSSNGGTLTTCLNNTSVPGAGGVGGNGGPGGAGSGGAGGNGGPSIGIALTAGAAAPTFDAVYPGTAGSGAGGGSGGGGAPGNCNAVAGRPGFTGITAATFVYGGPSWSAVLPPGQTLANNQALTGLSSQLVMQGDGNLCLYMLSGHQFLWCSNEMAGGSQSVLTMQSDGNLCVVVPQTGQEPKPIWCSGSYGHPQAYLALHSDGYVAVLQGTTEIWREPQK